jgi:hypothetical protein
MPWHYDPQSGGQKISAHTYDSLRRQAEDFSRTRPWYERSRLVLRFKNQFCYVDEQGVNDSKPSAFIRLRYFRDQAWSLAYYTWSHERYEPCLFASGKWEGTLEEAIQTCENILS